MTTDTTQQAPAAPPTDRQLRLLLAVVSAATFLASLDLFIVNIAFPTLAVAFPDAGSSLAWVLNGYTITFAALLAPAGRLADRFGRRRVFLLGLAVFTLASVGCAVAWDVWSLVAFRVLQGIGGAMVTGTSLALLLHSFPPARRGTAIATWAAIGAVAAALGPPLGGLLVELSWRWVFLVNVPVGLLAVVVGLRVLTESKDATERRRPDVLGTVVLIAAVAALSYALIQAPDSGWASATTLGWGAAAVLLTVAAVLRSAKVGPQLVPALSLPLFRSRPYTLSSVAIAAFFGAFGAMLLHNVYWLTTGWGMSTVLAGIALTPGPVVAAVAALAGGKLGARFGHGVVAAVGGLSLALGVLWWVVLVDTTPDYLVAFLPGQLLTGLGVGFTIANLSTSASASLPPQWLATGTATFNAARQLGATLGVALLLAVVPLDESGGLAAADRGWWLSIGLALTASVTAAFIRRPAPAG
jgi:EmrB/QacA subfamily drug resistance transporter